MYNIFYLIGVVVVVLALLYLLNPVISHATIRAALRSGVKPWGEDRR